MQLRLMTYQECSVCRENSIGSDNNPYKTNNHEIPVCPNCKQEVSKETQSDKNYKKRSTRFINKITKEQSDN